MAPEALARFMPVWQGIERPRRGLDGLSDSEVRKITWENASRLFRHEVPAEMQVPAPTT